MGHQRDSEETGEICFARITPFECMTNAEQKVTTPVTQEILGQKKKVGNYPDLRTKPPVPIKTFQRSPQPNQYRE